MNYYGKKIAITGRGGFIAEALAGAAQSALATVCLGPCPGQTKIVWIDGDIRQPSTFKQLDHTIDYLFHFAAPSSQVQFKRSAMYCADVTINGFINAAKACKQNGIKLIYPSTGLLSAGTPNEYARCKAICEDIAAGEKLDALGVRIFASYGPGEGHKRDYASVPFLFARDMVQGKAPVIFGDGNQVRDFIYIDDVVNALLILAEECNDPVIDIGSGTQHSFNDIVTLVNQALSDSHDPIEAQYIEKPGGYVQETVCDPSRLVDFYVPKVTFKKGIKRLVDSLKEGR